MVKVVGLIGSPRKLGNSELIVKEISRNIPEKHELVLVNLTKMDLKPCTGCYQCLFKQGRCSLNDNMSTVIDELSDANGLILAAPTYFLGPYGIVKIFTDRALMFLARMEEFYGKPAVTVALAGIAGGDGYSPMALASAAFCMGFDVKDQGLVHAALPGEAVLSEKNKSIAAHLGRVLLDPDYVRRPKAHECNLCSGNAFKFLNNDEIECLTCHNRGKTKWPNETPHLEIAPDSHNILGDLEARLAHRSWLMGMKDKFKERKAILKDVSIGYSNEGRWVHKKGEE
ncbi:MAG: flavodoxin family protein [Desulfomonilaceae bacterium]